MADEKRVSATGTGTGLESLAGLLKMFGENQKQTVSSNTGPLQKILAELMQPQDGNAQLASIFQQAAGGIPKFQAAFGNAVGARSGGNSSVNAALQSLLQQTTLAGQKQLADQNLQRQQLAIQGTSNLAQATHGVSQKTTPNLGDAGKALGVLQLAGKLGITDKIKQGLLGASAAAGTGGAADVASFQFSPDLFTATQPNFFGGGDILSSAYPSASGGLANFDYSSLTQAFDPAMSLGSAAYDFGGAADAAGDVANGIGDAASGFFDDAVSWAGDAWEGVTNFFGFADGGLVGRDGEPVGKFTMVDEAAGYADGGIVRAGGGRRSSAPSYDPLVRPTTSALNTREEQFGLPELRPRLDRTISDLVDSESGRDRDTGGLGESTSTATQATPGAISVANTIGQGIQGIALGMALGPAVSGLVGALGLSGLPGLAATALGKSALTQALQAAIGSGTAAAPSGLGDVGEGDEGNTPSPGDPAADAIGDAPATGGSGDSGPSGGSGADGNGPGGTGSGPGNGPGGDAAWKDGGEIKGPGTGTSDSIRAMLSNGEYVVSDDVVDAIGVEFFDRLQTMFHKTAGGQNG